MSESLSADGSEKVDQNCRNYSCVRSELPTLGLASWQDLSASQVSISYKSTNPIGSDWRVFPPLLSEGGEYKRRQLLDLSSTSFLATSG